MFSLCREPERAVFRSMAQIGAAAGRITAGGAPPILATLGDGGTMGAPPPPRVGDRGLLGGWLSIFRCMCGLAGVLRSVARAVVFYVTLRDEGPQCSAVSLEALCLRHTSTSERMKHGKIGLTAAKIRARRAQKKGTVPFFGFLKSLHMRTRTCTDQLEQHSCRLCRRKNP